MTQDDRTTDLLPDLSRSGALPPSPVPAPVPVAALPTTPAFTWTVTPLRWALPGLDATERGLGLAMKAGPWRFELAL